MGPVRSGEMPEMAQAPVLDARLGAPVTIHLRRQQVVGRQQLRNR